MKTQLASFILLIIVSCSNGVPDMGRKVGQGIDISPDGGSVVLSYSNNGATGIYEYDLGTSTLIKLTTPVKGIHIRPKYSPDMNSILFLEYPDKNFESCNLVVLNLKNKTSESIIKGKKNLTDALFSRDGNSILFICAESIGKVPNGNDLYSVDRKTKKIQQITHLNSYSFADMVPVNDTMILAQVHGMGSINLLTGKFKPIKVQNDTRSNVEGLFSPIDLKDSVLFYYAPYQIYCYNFKKKINKLMFEWTGHGHFYSIRLDSSKTKMVFTESEKLYLFDFAKAVVKDLKIN